VADVECGATFGPPRVPTRRFQPPTLIGLQRSAAGVHSIAATGTVPPANVDPRAACERPRARHVAPAECIATRTDLTAAASCRTLEPYRTSGRKAGQSTHSAPAPTDRYLNHPLRSPISDRRERTTGRSRRGTRQRPGAGPSRGTSQRVITINHGQPDRPGERHAPPSPTQRGHQQSVLPHERLHQLPPARPRDRGRHVPDLRLPSPSFLADPSRRAG